MKQYTFNDSKFGTHNLIAEEIGENKKVLDIGCNKGYLKKLSPNNIFYGIDYDENDLKIAQEEMKYEKVFKLDLNNFSEFKINEKFDVIILADVLEHLIFPEKVLDFFAKNYLKEGGKIILSLPNVANIAIRIQLLFGKFNYTESGILDKTHLHLYTVKTGKELIEKTNLKIRKNKFSSNNFGRLIRLFPYLGKLLGYNLIFICKKND